MPYKRMSHQELVDLLLKTEANTFFEAAQLCEKFAEMLTASPEMKSSAQSCADLLYLHAKLSKERVGKG